MAKFVYKPESTLEENTFIGALSEVPSFQGAALGQPVGENGVSEITEAFVRPDSVPQGC